MEEKTFLPIGSVVTTRGEKKFLIAARAVFLEEEGEERYFDYAACTYPEGLLGGSIQYFQSKDIAEIVARGYEDENTGRMMESIRAGMKKIKEEKTERAN